MAVTCMTSTYFVYLFHYFSRVIAMDIEKWIFCCMSTFKWELLLDLRLNLSLGECSLYKNSMNLKWRILFAPLKFVYTLSSALYLSPQILAEKTQSKINLNHKMFLKLTNDPLNALFSPRKQIATIQLSIYEQQSTHFQTTKIMNYYKFMQTYLYQKAFWALHKHNP